MRAFSIVFALCFAVCISSGQFIQQGNKLVGTGAVGGSWQGTSVALSADGNTAIVGGYQDNMFVGAAWMYTRSGGVWSQQGSKLVGTGVVGSANQGCSVALSADGNTAIVGGYRDDSDVGSAWVFTRSGGLWSQEGNKLVGTGAVGGSWQGASVALSADGNTAIVGGRGDNGNVGAVWMYTRSGGVWSQQGSKLVGTGAVGIAQQGRSVALSADGNTAIVGGNGDNGEVGATWVYTRSGEVWSQQGDKLVGTGAVGSAQQGYSVSLSADGNTAVVGGFRDDNDAGSAWAYTRSGGVWSQQGNKLVGTGAVGGSRQGASIALSADGNTAIVGGYGDNGVVGATWIQTRSGGVWSQQGNKLVGTGAVGTARQGYSVALSADGNTAIVGGPTDNSLSGAVWAFARNELVAYYSFNGNANDSSGNGHHGTLVNTPTLTTDRFGQADGAYYFNGVNQRIDLPSSISIPANLSLSLWVRTTLVDTTNWPNARFIIDRDICYIGRDWSVGLGAGGRVQFHTGTDVTGYVLTSRREVNDSAWHHVVVLRDTADQLKAIYIDGQLDTTEAFNNQPFGNNNLPIYVSASVCETGLHKYFEGTIDEVRFYSRVLTVEEIRELYRDGPVSGDLVLTLLDAEDWGPTGPSGWVDLYTHDGTLVGEVQANDSSIVTFSQIPADTGYYYRVLCNRVTAWGPQQFWGGKTGITVTAGQTTYDTHIHNTPYMPNVSVYLDSTNELLPDGGNKPVAAGTRLRIELEIKNPAYDGAQSVSAYGGLCLDRDMTAPYDVTRYSSTNSYDTGTIRTVAFYVDAPDLPGPYYLSVAAFAFSSQYDTSLTDASGWHDPAFTVLPTPSIPVLEFPGDRSKNIQTSPTLRWYTVDGALDYHLQLSTDSTFSSALIVNDSTIVDTSHSIGPLANNTTYFWRVRSRTAEGMSSFSAPWRFTTLLPLPTQVQLVNPVSGTSVNVATLGFVWRKASPEVTRYWFEIATDSMLVFKMIDSTVTDTTCVRQNLSSGTYWWRVRAGNESGWGEFSDTWRLSVVITGLGDGSEIPTQYELYQNYPNPFNPSTTIRYALPQASKVTLIVSNTLGQRVAKLVQEEQPAGYYEVRFDGAGLASGVYLYRLQAGVFVQTRKLVLLR